MNEGSLNIAIRAAREAGKIITRAIQKVDKIDVEEKGLNDFVTEVDRAAETKIIDTIRHFQPQHQILSEESGHLEGESADHLWIIDPLDGTTNFIHGYPHCVVSIALQIKGVIEYGVIYQPFSNDLFVAARGKGALLNDRRIRIAKRPSFEGALVSMGLPRPVELLPAYLELSQALQGKIAGLRRSGSTAYDLACVAAGMLDLCWNVDGKIWDVAAGVLLIKEAGGIVCNHEGGENFSQDGHLLAGHSKLVRAALQKIHPHLPKAT